MTLNVFGKWQNNAKEDIQEQIAIDIFPCFRMRSNSFLHTHHFFSLACLLGACPFPTRSTIYLKAFCRDLFLQLKTLNLFLPSPIFSFSPINSILRVALVTHRKLPLCFGLRPLMANRKKCYKFHPPHSSIRRAKCTD